MKSRDFQLAKTSHIDCAVFEYGAARLGLYERAAGRKVRSVIHGAIAMRGSAARRRSRYRHHPSDRISTDSWIGDSAGFGDRLAEPCAQFVDYLEEAD